MQVQGLGSEEPVSDRNTTQLTGSVDHPGLSRTDSAAAPTEDEDDTDAPLGVTRGRLEDHKPMKGTRATRSHYEPSV